MSKTTKKQKIILAALVVGILAIAVGVSAVKRSHNQQMSTSRDKNGISQQRTPQDIALENQLNNDPSRKSGSTQSDRPADPKIDNTTNLQKVNVILTNSNVSGGTVSASGFVSNVVESNGVCTYTFAKQAESIKKTSATLPNATSTTCTTVQFPVSELSSGTWQVSLGYASGASAGDSNVLELVVK